MSFKKNKYKVIKKAVSYELANFIFNYFLLQKDAVYFCLKNNIVSENNLFIGNWKDAQAPGVYSKYGDWVMETLLMKVMPVIEKKINLKLIPTYSYARVYEKGSILERHKDRPSCEISTTLNLGGDPWALFIDSTGGNNNSGIKVDLEPGDMLVYSGCELEHWREEFQGNVCAQVFLHYNHVNGQFADSNLYDKRPLLGIPLLRK